jgi:protein-L-isoaspartate O-methyltransferase
MSVDSFAEQRRQKIAAIKTIIDQASTGNRVLHAMAKVPRHEFVPVENDPYYANIPAPIVLIKRSHSR